MKRMANNFLTQVCKHSTWAAFVWMLLSTSALAQERNDSIDRSQFVAFYRYTIQTQDDEGNAPMATVNCINGTFYVDMTSHLLALPQSHV